MKVSNLTKIYVTEYDTVKALNDMSIDFPTQGLVFIVGVSGSGKSTLMNMLSGVDVPSCQYFCSALQGAGHPCSSRVRHRICQLR